MYLRIHQLFHAESSWNQRLFLSYVWKLWKTVSLNVIIGSEQIWITRKHTFRRINNLNEAVALKGRDPTSCVEKEYTTSCLTDRSPIVMVTFRSRDPKISSCRDDRVECNIITTSVQSNTVPSIDSWCKWMFKIPTVTKTHLTQKLVLQSVLHCAISWRCNSEYSHLQGEL